MDTLFFIQMSRDQPSAHEVTKVHEAAVTGTTAGVSAPRMLPGPLGEIKQKFQLVGSDLAPSIAANTKFINIWFCLLQFTICSL